MGNATSGEAALVMVDRPFIPSLETSEDIEVVLTVKGETVTLGEWPARAIAVPPPARGFLRATAWAVNPDDDEERREIGQILVHHTSLEAFEEPYIQLWLGLLDPSIVPQSQYCGIDEAHKCFTNSIEVAKDPEQPKVCLTIAAIRPELLTASRVQDMLEYQRELTEKPMMQLFQNTNDIIQGLSRQYTQTCRDLRCLRREFRTKENVFQGFVRVEKVNKEETKQRWEENTAKTAAKFAKMFTGVMAKEIVTSWRKATFEKSMDNLKTKLANANKKTALIVGQFLGKNATPEQLGRMMHKVLKAWAKSAKQWRTQLKMIHRMVPLDGHIAMEMAIHGWKQVMATEEREQPAKVGLDFTVKGVSHWDLEADTDLMSSLAACVKAGLFQLCAKEGYTNLPAGAMKMALEHRNDGSRVKCQMTPGSSNDAAILKKKIDPKLKLIGTDLGTRVIAVPSIFTVCAGPISITEMATSYIRHQSQQARRDDLADKFDQVIDWYQKVDHLYVQQLILRSWHADTEMSNHKEAHKKSLDEQLDQRHKEAQAREARANASHQAAKNSVALMVKKWQMGNIQGLLVETFSVWHEYTALWVQKRKGQAAVRLSLHKFFEGETKAIMSQVMSLWRKHAHHVAELGRHRQAINDALVKAMLGEQRGTLAMCISSWAHDAKSCKAQKVADDAVRQEAKKYEDFVNDMKDGHGKELSRHLTEAQIRKEQAHEATAMMLRRWAAGETKGLLMTIMAEWRRFVEIQQDLMRRREKAKLAVMGWLEGKDKAIVHMCFTHFVHFYEREKITKSKSESSQEQAKKYEDFVNDMKVAHGKELERHLSEAEIKKEQAHEATTMMLRRWAAGETKGLMSTIIAEWKRFLDIEKDLARRHEAAKMSVMKFIEGDNRAVVHMCFTHFVHYHETEKIHRAKAKEQSKYEEFLNDMKAGHEKELDRHLTEAEKRKEQAHEATTMMLRRWAMGETKGLQSTIICEWNRFVDIQKDLKRRHEAAKLSVMKWVEGDDKALVHMCFTHWVHNHEQEKVHRLHSEEANKYQAFVNEMKDAHGKELERHMTDAQIRKEQAHEATTMMLRKWAAGDQKGLMMTICAEWQRFVSIQKDLQRRHEQAKLSVMKFIEGDNRAIVHLCFTHFAHYAEQEKVHAAHNKALQESLDSVFAEANGKLSELEIKQQTAKNAVELALRKWAKGETEGLRAEVFDVWHHHCAKIAAAARQRAAVQASLMKFFEGETAGLIHTVFEKWHKEVAKKLALLRQRAAVRESLCKFLEGEMHGIMHSTFLSWQAFAKEAQLHGLHSKEFERQRQEMQDMLSDAAKKYADDAQSQRERDKEAKHIAVEYALKSWEGGKEHAAVDQVFHHWQAYASKRAMAGRGRQAVHAALLKAMMGECRAAAQLCFTNWSSDAAHCKIQREADEKDRKASGEWQRYIDEQKESHGKELERIMTEGERRKEAAHEASQMMLKKWFLGEEKGLMCSIVQEWRRYVDILQDLQRRHEATKQSVMSWIEGQDKAVVHMCWTHWVHYNEQQKLHHKHDDLQSNLDKLGDDRLAWQSEQEARHARTKNAVELAVRKWTMGNVAALKKEVFDVWHTGVAQEKQKRREQAAVRQQLEKFLRGDKLGDMHICFSSWHKLSSGQVALRTQRNAVQAQLRQFLEGETRGLQDTCFKEWKHFLEGAKQMRASSKEAEEKHLLNAIEVAKQKDAKLRAMQALGLKDVKGVKMHHFLLWSTAYMQAKEARIQAKKHDHMIDKAMLAMAGNDAKVILGVLMNEWHMLLPDKMLLKAEHAHQVEAEERVRLFKLHKKDVQRMMAKALMSDGMMAVHVALGSWHKLIQSKRLRQGGDAMKKETMKTAGAAMNKAINKWASDAPRVLLHTVLRALNEEVKEARQARAHGNVRDVRQAWRASALHGGRHFVNLFEGRELHVYLVHWVVAINLSKWRRSSGFLQECADLNATTDSSREQLMAWRAEATTQRSRNLGVDCHHIMKHARKQHAEGLHAVRESETMRTHMAVNLFAADQRAQEALEHGDKLGVATGSLQGEMHTHNLTLDALEHELLLLESQIANSDVLGKKKSAFVQRLVSA